jgi:hypothetical protein
LRAVSRWVGRFRVRAAGDAAPRDRPPWHWSAVARLVNPARSACALPRGGIHLVAAAAVGRGRACARSALAPSLAPRAPALAPRGGTANLPGTGARVARVPTPECCFGWTPHVPGLPPTTRLPSRGCNVGAAEAAEAMGAVTASSAPAALAAGPTHRRRSSCSGHSSQAPSAGRNAVAPTSPALRRALSGARANGPARAVSLRTARIGWHAMHAGGNAMVLERRARAMVLRATAREAPCVPRTSVARQS